MNMFNCITCEIISICVMFDHLNNKCRGKSQAITIYTRCIVVRHNSLHLLSKANHKLCNFIKIKSITIKDKIKQKV